jgi:hypothetical protein
MKYWLLRGFGKYDITADQICTSLVKQLVRLLVSRNCWGFERGKEAEDDKNQEEKYS